MKIFLIFVILLFINICYSQSDTTVLNTPAVFSITFHEDKEYLLFERGSTTYDEVFLDVLTQDFITFRKKYPYDKNPKSITTSRRIALKDIKSLGYVTGTEETFGAILGMGIGAVGGTIISLVAKSFDQGEGKGKFNPGSTESITAQVLGWTGAGAILGYLIGGKSNEYKKFDLSTYNNEKKYLEINNIVKKALSNSKK